MLCILYVLCFGVAILLSLLSLDAFLETKTWQIRRNNKKLAGKHASTIHTILVCSGLPRDLTKIVETYVEPLPVFAILSPNLVRKWSLVQRDDERILLLHEGLEAPDDNDNDNDTVDDHTCIFARQNNTMYMRRSGRPPSLLADSFEAYDHCGKRHWVPVAQPPTRHRKWHHSLTATVEHRIYLFGGDGSRGWDTEWYDITNDKWYAGPSSFCAHEGGCVVVFEQRIYLIGGSGAQECEVFDPLTHTWTLLKPMPQKRRYGVTCAVVDDHVVLVGGSHDSHPASSLLAYSPHTNEWRILAVSLSNTISDQHKIKSAWFDALLRALVLVTQPRIAKRNQPRIAKRNKSTAHVTDVWVCSSVNLDAHHWDWEHVDELTHQIRKICP